jgi:hypothetical protein
MKAASSTGTGNDVRDGALKAAHARDLRLSFL